MSGDRDPASERGTPLLTFVPGRGALVDASSRLP